MLMAVRIQIANFKLCQYQQRAISPNLMLAKVTHYTVCKVEIGEFNII